MPIPATDARHQAALIVIDMLLDCEALAVKQEAPCMMVKELSSACACKGASRDATVSVSDQRGYWGSIEGLSGLA